jgi:ankyrin repeat protein
MIVACQSGEEEIEEALARGADVNAKSGMSCSPLMFASAFNTAAAVKYLIERGADPEARNAREETALHIALRRSPADAQSVRVLIEAGADVNAADGEGYTPLLLAASQSAEIVKALIDAGADTGALIPGENGEQKNAMSIALRSKCFRVVRALLAAGMNLNEPSEDSSEDSDDDWGDIFDDPDDTGNAAEDDGEALSEAAARLREYGLKV